MNEPGLPVEIGQIDRELGRLWEASGDTKTRASLINLVIYTEAPESLQTNTELLSTIASQHAFRAILILANPHAESSGAKAWISAHCHLADKGGQQICSEQITFQLDGGSASALPSIVFSHLDSDLPLCFWSQAEFTGPPDDQLWSWVDRLIFDSRSWKHPGAQFSLTRKIAEAAGPVLCDLNWTRLQPWCFALANLFDHAATLERLRDLSSVQIACCQQSSTTALLLLGWLADRLGWKLEPLLSVHSFADAHGRTVSFEIAEEGTHGLAGVTLGGTGFSFRLHREPATGFFHASLHIEGSPDACLTLGAARERLTDTLLAELSRGGRHPLYSRAVPMIAPLLS